MVKNPLAGAGDVGSIPEWERFPWRRKLNHSSILAFPMDRGTWRLQSMESQRVGHDLAGKESACNAGDPGSIPGSERSAGEGIGYLLWYSGLENSMNRGAWQATVHGVPKSWTRLSDDFHFHFAPNPVHWI